LGCLFSFFLSRGSESECSFLDHHATATAVGHDDDVNADDDDDDDNDERFQASFQRPHVPRFKALAVATDVPDTGPPATPCGMCR
jgi:hypothetical protein